MAKQSEEAVQSSMTGTREKIENLSRILRQLADLMNKGCVALRFKELADAMNQASLRMRSYGDSIISLRLRYINDNWVRGKKLQSVFLTKGQALKCYLFRSST